MARKTYYLKEEFGLDHTKGNREIGSDMQLAEAKSLFPRMYARMRARGPAFLGRALTDLEFMRLKWFDPCWGEAKLQGQGGGQPFDTGYLSSNNEIVVPFGTYRHSIPAEFSAGEYEFEGPGYTDIGNDSTNTKLEVDHEGWLGHPSHRHTLVSGKWMQPGNLAYEEGFMFHNVRVNGRQQDSAAIIGAKFESYGLMAWKPGEVTDSDRIWFENYRTSGGIFYAPTPHKLGNISAFGCVESGIRFAGSWGGSVLVDIESSDNCGAMFDTVALNNTEAGGVLVVNLIKNESLVASEGRSWRGQIIGHIRGQFAVIVNGFNGSVGNGRIPAAFIVDGRLSDGSMQSSYLSVKGKAYQIDAVVHDVARGHIYRIPRDYYAGGWEYYTDNGQMIHRGTTMLPETGKATFRVNHRVGDKVTKCDFDAATAQPYREIIAGPPTFATITYLSDAVLTPPPVEPPPVDPPPPVEPPPTTPGVIATISPASNTNPSAQNPPVNWVGVKRIRFTNVRFTDTNYKRFGWKSETDNYGVNLKPDGYFYDNSNKKCTQTSKIVAGTTYPTMDVTLPNSTDLKYYLAKPGNGAALLFSADKVEVLSA